MFLLFRARELAARLFFVGTISAAAAFGFPREQ
jgi:hypothetical protein